MRIFFSLGASRRDKRRLAFIDIKKAHLYAVCERKVFVQLPEGYEQEGMCGQLNYTLYGTRDAAQSWEKECTNTLIEAGFVQGQASTCVFRHEANNIDIVVHGDDFTAFAEHHHIQWLRQVLAAKYELKFRGTLGPSVERGETPEITVLNRVVRWTSQGIEYEADPRHVEIIVHEL